MTLAGAGAGAEWMGWGMKGRSGYDPYDHYYLSVDDGRSSRGTDFVVRGVPVHPHVVQ